MEKIWRRLRRRSRGAWQWIKMSERERVKFRETVRMQGNRAGEYWKTREDEEGGKR